MLWYKSWRETRSRFLTGLVVLAILAAGTVFDYPAVAKLVPMARAVDSSTAIGRAISEAVDLERTYRGFIWLQWFRQNLAQTITLLAILLGSGGLIANGPFTFSLPVSRRRALTSRATVALGELLALAIVPSVLVAVFSPMVGEHYPLTDAVVQAACAFVGAAAFLSAALFLSTEFADIWRPLLMTCAGAIALAIAGRFVPALSHYGVFGAMTAEAYFRTGAPPWPALVVSAAVSAALLYAATINFARRDF